ncbi:unnamed protein product [Absidia cylindrospora]
MLSVLLYYQTLSFYPSLHCNLLLGISLFFIFLVTHSSIFLCRIWQFEPSLQLIYLAHPPNKTLYKTGIMSNSIVTNVYRYVIDNVINQVRAEFEDMGMDEAVLQELQRSWETKVAQSRVANFGFNNEGYYEDDGEQNNVNNDTDKNTASTTNTGNSNNNAYSEAYSQAGAPPATVANLATIANSGARNVLRPPNPLQQHPSQPPNTSSSSIPYSLPPTNMPHLPPVNGAGQYPPMNLHQPPQQQYHQQQQQQPTLPDLHLPGGGRPNIPQNDGPNAVMTTAVSAFKSIYLY